MISKTYYAKYKNHTSKILNISISKNEDVYFSEQVSAQMEPKLNLQISKMHFQFRNGPHKTFDNVVIKDTESVKLSFHASGQVHIRTSDLDRDMKEYTKIYSMKFNQEINDGGPVFTMLTYKCNELPDIKNLKQNSYIFDDEDINHQVIGNGKNMGISLLCFHLDSKPENLTSINGKHFYNWRTYKKPIPIDVIKSKNFSLGVGVVKTRKSNPNITFSMSSGPTQRHGDGCFVINCLYSDVDLNSKDITYSNIKPKEVS